MEFEPLKRTHTCGELRKSDTRKKIILNGWVHRWRDHGGLLFIDLRDRYGVTQVVFKPDLLDQKTMNEAAHLRAEYVVSVEGEVNERPEGMANKDLPTGEIEVIVKKMTVLNQSKTPPFEIEEETNANEELRLKYRYLDLRRSPLQERIKIRHQNGKGLSGFTRLLRDRNSPFDEEHPGRGEGFHRPKPGESGEILRFAPVSSALEADIDDFGVRQIFPDSPLSERRGSEGGSSTGAHPN